MATRFNPDAWSRAPALAFLITPMLALLLRSLDHLSDLNAQNRAIIRSALILSLKTSSITMVIILITGTPLAYLMARHSFRGQSVIETIIDLPIILPPAVAGLALLMAFGRRGILGAHLNAWGYQIGFSTTAVVIAQIFVASPFFVRTASAAFADVARIQEEAAADLFAKPWAIMRTITLPLAAPACLPEWFWRGRGPSASSALPSCSPGIFPESRKRCRWRFTVDTKPAISIRP